MFSLFLAVSDIEFHVARLTLSNGLKMTEDYTLEQTYCTMVFNVEVEII